jgi:carbonyl reductase 1
VSSFAAWLERTYPAGIDILCNNAGQAFKGSTWGADEATITIGTNVFGTMRVTNALLPSLKRKSGRIINVCSQAGKQRIIRSDALRRRFAEASSEDSVRALMDEFIAAIRDNTYASKGWPQSMYGISKLGEATWTRVLAQQQRNVTVSACCPGWCSTDMSSHMGPRSAAQGADVAVWLALAPTEDVPSGRFWSDRREEGF